MPAPEPEGAIVLTLSIKGEEAASSLDVEETLPCLETLALIREGLTMLLRYALHVGEENKIPASKIMELMKMDEKALAEAGE